jgi:DNA-binding transcriptional regulator/RsmH inhibitor MraZ
MEQRRLTGIETPSTAVVIGMGSRVEIWPEARWNSYSTDAQGRFTEFADRVISGR